MRGNHDLFRIALSINKNTRRLHRYYAGSAALRCARADKEIRGIPPRRRERASCTLSSPSTEGRDRACDLWIVAVSPVLAGEVPSSLCAKWSTEEQNFRRINKAQPPSNPATQISVHQLENDEIRDCLCRKSQSFLQSRWVCHFPRAARGDGWRGSQSFLEQRVRALRL